MSETRKIAAILVADVVGYSRLAGADEDRTLSRLRGLRSDLIDPAIAAHHGRIVKRTGDGSLIEFRSVVDAVRCAIEVQNGMVERNAGVPPTAASSSASASISATSSRRRRRPDGRRRQYRRAARRHLRAGRDLSFRGRLSAGQGAARSGGHRPRPESSSRTSPSRSGSIRSKSASRRRRSPRRRRSRPSRRTRSARGSRFSAPGSPRCSSWSRPAPGISSAPTDPRPSRRSRRPSAARLSIVVLPFANLSGDPAQDYLADALTDELTTAIARLRDSFVIAHSTALTYKGKPVDAKAIGKELGVRYVLEGSVQPTGNQVRVNAQLIDAESGAHLWAEQFDTPRADLLQTQDEIVTRLARSMYLQLPEVEAARLKRTPAANPDAEDLALQCQAGFLKNEAVFLATYYRLRTGARRRSRQCPRPDLLGHHVLAFARPRPRPGGHSNGPTNWCRKRLRSIQTTLRLTSSKLSYSSPSSASTKRSPRTDARSTWTPASWTPIGTWAS